MNKITLHACGIDFEGAIEAAMALNPWSIPELRPHFERGVGRDFWTADGRRFLTRIGPFEEGGNSNVEEWASYERGSRGSLHFVESVYEKRSKNGQNLLTEACLQIFAYNILEAAGFKGVIARTLQIYRRNDTRDIAFTMEPFYRVVNLHAALLELCPRLYGPAFDVWFIPILIQIIILIGLLEEHAGINHRDLKGDNILISKDAVQKNKEIVLGGRTWNFTYKRSVHVVDFGFACRGPRSGSAASISAGDFFTLTDVCPKDGRDIYILLCYFWAQPHWRASASPKLLNFVRDFLRVQKILDHLEVHGLSRTKYIYFLLSEPEFSSKSCTPTALLGALTMAWPALLGVH